MKFNYQHSSTTMACILINEASDGSVFDAYVSKVKVKFLHHY